MALSDADLDAAWTKARSKNGPQWVPYFEALRAVAALVRKDDDALILQLVEALDDLVEAGEEAWSECRPCVRIGKKAATAGRAWLEGRQ